MVRLVTSLSLILYNLWTETDKTSDCVTGVFLKVELQTTRQLQNSGVLIQIS